MPMPSLTDLQGMYGDWNPQAYLQAQNNAGLERQFREQQYAQEQAKAEKDALANLWSREDRPRNVEEQVLRNRNLDYTGQGTFQDNRLRGVNADIAESTKQFKLDEEQRKALLAVPEHEIKMGELSAQKMMQSLDPEVRKRGEQLYEFTKFSRDAKLKFEREMEKERYTQMQTTGRHIETLTNQREVANINQAGQNARAATKAKAGGVDFWSSYYKMKSARDKHSSLVAEARKIMADSPEEAQKMLAMAEDIRPQAEAEIATVKPGGIATGAVTGLPTNPSPQIAPPSGSVDPKKTQGVKSLADLQGMYPGVPPAKLKELYKKKFGVDLQ